MRFSDITIEDKESEALDLIHSFSKMIISDIDRTIQQRKPDLKEAPYIDLMVESFFSIRAFCVLIKEGLISSAAAIMRIILEQVSIFSLLTKYPKAKESFENIKLEKQRYYSSSDCEKQFIEKDLLDTKQIKPHNIKQYFDYGWYKEAGCQKMKLKSICEAASTSAIYDVVDLLLNEFAHGQRSMYQLRRQNNGVDRKFVRNLYQDLFQLFFLLVSSMVRAYGEDIISRENKACFDMVEAIDFDLRSRFAEQNLILDLKQDNIEHYDLHQHITVICQNLMLLEKMKDPREKYLLSQSYVRWVKQLLALDVYSRNRNKGRYEMNEINMKGLFGFYQPDLKDYECGTMLSFDKIIEMLDMVDDDWALGNDPIDYVFTRSINRLMCLIDQRDCTSKTHLH